MDARERRPQGPRRRARVPRRLAQLLGRSPAASSSTGAAARPRLSIKEKRPAPPRAGPQAPWPVKVKTAGPVSTSSKKQRGYRRPWPGL